MTEKNRRTKFEAPHDKWAEVIERHEELVAGYRALFVASRRLFPIERRLSRAVQVACRDLALQIDLVSIVLDDATYPVAMAAGPERWPERALSAFDPLDLPPPVAAIAEQPIKKRTEQVLREIRWQTQQLLNLVRAFGESAVSVTPFGDVSRQLTAPVWSEIPRVCGRIERRVSGDPSRARMKAASRSGRSGR